MAKKSKSKGCGQTYNVHRLGLFFVALFTLCYFWGFINPVDPALHLSLMKLSFLGFTGLNSASFFFGAVQVYLWAWVFAFAWYSIMPAKK